MLLYFVLILLPATALAECQPDVYWNLFRAGDTDSNNKLQLSECYATFNVFDDDNDGVVTVDDIKRLAPQIATVFVGHEQPLVDFVDQDWDGILTIPDIDQEFATIDTNDDGFKDEDEYRSYIDIYCSR